MKRSSNSPFRSDPQPGPPPRLCDRAGCAHAGEYRAPKSRSELYDYYWFCLEHVRAYNAAWDFYAGMSPEEIEEMVRQDVTWQRPTWRLGERTSGRSFSFDTAGIRDPFGIFTEECEDPVQKRRPPTPEEEAMRVLELRASFTVLELKARYKELVKRHHPDANGGDKAAEERFKVISQAYKTLLNSINA